jgi:hypothetical protein
VGLHSSMRLAAVLAVANSTVLVLLATAVAAEGLVLTLLLVVLLPILIFPAQLVATWFVTCCPSS